MRIVKISPDVAFYRFLTPRWAHLPTSGAGAAQNGGRFNRPGVEALYLSGEPETALAEYRQGSSLPPPGTLVAYRIDTAEIVDFSEGTKGTFDDFWTGWDCDWKAIARLEGEVPSSWKIGDELIRAGRRGLLFPSIRRPGGTNLVVFCANLTGDDRIEAHDPDNALPKDQSSWPS